MTKAERLREKTVKEILRWEANDGSVWTSPEKAKARDALIAACDAKVEELGLDPRPDE